MRTKQLILLAIGFLPTALLIHAEIFNPAREYSATHNPQSVWSYGWCEKGGSEFHLYGEAFDIDGRQAWFRGFDVNGNAAPNVGFNSNYTATPAVGSVVLKPREMTQHPGLNGEESIIRWTAPGSGPVNLNVAFEGRDYVGPTSTDVAVYLNHQKLFSGFVSGFGAVSRKQFSTHLVVSAGDHIEFHVGTGGNDYGADSTQTKAEIAFGNSSESLAYRQLAGLYNAIFQNSASLHNSARVFLYIDANGRFSGKVQASSKAFPFSGKFDQNGHGDALLLTREAPGRLQMELSRDGSVRGQVFLENWSAPFSGARTLH